MALYAVLSDIHANREALDSVMEHVRNRGVEKILCLGDIVGYNADPDYCVGLLRECGVDSIAGNHDLMAVGKLGFENCWYRVAFTIVVTKRSMREENLRFLKELPTERIYENRFALVHGSLRGPEEYMFSKERVHASLEEMRKRLDSVNICFFGHTHVRKVYEISGGDVRDISLGKELKLCEEKIYFINPGSVDSTRKKGDGNADFLIYDSGSHLVEFISLPYDVEKTVRKSKELGYRMNIYDIAKYMLFHAF
ncbi:metallophosphoesterase family protein [Candidatus Poribacteria bacterium]|nr:metallophosphoesterase family protein [Candidatus Poribacteria bacterium]